MILTTAFAIWPVIGLAAPSRFEVLATVFNDKADAQNPLHVALPHAKRVNVKAGSMLFGIPGRTRVRVERITNPIPDPQLRRVIIAPVVDAGPQNIFDNYWEGSSRDRRGFDRPPATPTAEERAEICDSVPTSLNYPRDPAHGATDPLYDYAPEVVAALVDPQLFVPFNDGHTASKPTKANTCPGGPCDCEQGNPPFYDKDRLRYYRSPTDEGTQILPPTTAAIDLSVKACQAVGGSGCDNDNFSEDVTWAFTSAIPSVRRVRILQGTATIYDALGGVAGGRQLLAGSEGVQPGAWTVQIDFTESMALTSTVAGEALPLVSVRDAKSSTTIIGTVVPVGLGWQPDDEGVEDARWIGTVSIPDNVRGKDMAIAIYAEDLAGDGATHRPGNPIDADENPASTGTLDGYGPATREKPDREHIVHIKVDDPPRQVHPRLAPNGDLWGKPAINISTPDLHLVLPKLAVHLGRLFGFRPPTLLLPLRKADHWRPSFAALSFRGVNVDLCTYDEKASLVSPEDPEVVDGLLYAVRAEHQYSMAIHWPEDAAKVSVVGFGEGGLALANLLAPANPNLYNLQAHISTGVLANVPLLQKELLPNGKTNGMVDAQLIADKEVMELFAAIGLIWGAALVVPHPVVGAAFLQAGVGFLGWAGVAQLKCWAYSEITESVNESGIPGHAGFRAFFDRGLVTVGRSCETAIPSAECGGLIRDFATGDALKNMYSLLGGNIAGRRRLDDMTVGLVIGNTGQGALLTPTDGSLKEQAELDQSLGEINDLLPIGLALVRVLADTTEGNGTTTVESQRGDGVAAAEALKAGARTTIKEFSKQRPPGLSLFGGVLDFLGVAVEAIDTTAFRRNSAAALGDIIGQLDPPAVLTVTSPVPAWAVGFNEDRAFVRVEGHVSDAYPQFVKIVSSADGGPQVETELNLDTLTTDPGGRTGNAQFRMDVPLPHGGRHTVSVTAINAGGHDTTQAMTVYVTGTQFPQEGTVARGVTSYRWQAKSHPLIGTPQVLAEGVGRLSFIGTDPGKTPAQGFTVPGTVGGADLVVWYPNANPDVPSIPNPDIIFVNPASDEVIAQVPSSGVFEARLAPFHEGRTFVGIAGNAESKALKEWRLEYSGEAGVSASGGFLDEGHTILSSGVPIRGPQFKLMHFWDVSRQRLTGQYTIRTRLTDGYLPGTSLLVDTNYTQGTFASEDSLKGALDEFKDLKVLDRATFTLGTPFDPGVSVPTIVTDPYARVEVRVEGGSLVSPQTVDVNVFPVRAPPAVPLPDPALGALGPKYEVVAAPLPGQRLRLLPQDFHPGQEPRLTLHYTNAELTGLALSATLVADNLGLYREDAATGQRTLLETQAPPGTFTVFTTTGFLDGAFLLLPSNSAPRVRALAVSPLQFAPEDPTAGRPVAEAFLDVATAASPTVFVTAEVVDGQGTVVRTLASRVSVFLVEGQEEEAPLIAPDGADARVVEASAQGAQKRYHFFSSGAPRIATWDGKDDNATLVPSGPYTLRVRVMDGVGNTTTAQTTVVKDRLAPAGNLMGRGWKYATGV